MPEKEMNSLWDKWQLPRLGLGTWRMGEVAAHRAAELAAVRESIGMGYRLFDTAEMYGEGGAEQVLGEALGQALRSGDVRRGQLCVVSKFYPHHASRADVRRACERSRRRLGLDQIDLYLLHWRGPVPLEETVEALEGLVAGGAIRRWGVSNFDPADMRELQDLLGGAVGASARAPACAANQVYYSLGARGIEFDLLPQLQRSGIAAMAYSPLDQGALGRHPGLRALAQSHGVDPATLALAWVLRQPGMCAVPKAVGSAHLRANFEALRWAAQPAAQLQGVWQALDRMFAPPTRARPLAML